MLRAGGGACRRVEGTDARAQVMVVFRVAHARIACDCERVWGMTFCLVNPIDISRA